MYTDVMYTVFVNKKNIMNYHLFAGMGLTDGQGTKTPCWMPRRPFSKHKQNLGGPGKLRNFNAQTNGT